MLVTLFLIFIRLIAAYFKADDKLDLSSLQKARDKDTLEFRETFFQ